jgi:hypothetical protein
MGFSLAVSGENDRDQGVAQAQDRRDWQYIPIAEQCLVCPGWGRLAGDAVNTSL